MVAVQRGDPVAYDALYARWRDPIFRFLLRRTGAVPAAEDALQDTWIRLYRSRHRYDARKPFRGWLYAIAANAGHDAARPVREGFTLPTEVDDPVGLRDLLVSALHALDADDRRLLLLAIEGFEPAEIAGMLGVPAGTVRMRLSRARGRVRAAIGGDDA
jgi:RNA polymerase sigma-70 factor (ECF subfamily)